MKRIATTNAPAALGPYAQAVDTGDTVYCSGQLGLDPATGALAEGVQAQTHQALKNLQAVLREAGLTLDNVVKTTVFVQDLGDFGTVNEIYGSYFHGGFPARSCVQIAALPKGALVEIECIAVREDKKAGIKRGEIRKQAKSLKSSRLWTAGKQVTTE